jgi:hypothetical protein
MGPVTPAGLTNGNGGDFRHRPHLTDEPQRGERL